MTNIHNSYCLTDGCNNCLHVHRDSFLADVEHYCAHSISKEDIVSISNTDARLVEPHGKCNLWESHWVTIESGVLPPVGDDVIVQVSSGNDVLTTFARRTGSGWALAIDGVSGESIIAWRKD